MKRLLSVLLCALFVLCLVGCSDDEGGRLGTPSVTISDKNIASWQAISGALGYEYKINDGEAISLDKDITKIQLVESESISVRAIGDGEKYTDSDWSETVHAGSVPKLPAPVIEKTVVGEQVLLTWKADERATGYVYRINDGAEATLDSDALGYMVSISDTFYLRAKGDGVSYTDSDWATIKPEV